MKQLIKLLVVTLTATSTMAFAARYPVDNEIDGLRAKASYLEAMKNVFEYNNCSIEVGKSKVHLDAGALRSEGLVMAVNDTFPGNYLAFHKAPAAEKLEAVIDNTFLKSGMGKGAKIVTARLGFDEQSKKPNNLVVILNDPYQEPTSPELWFYKKGGVKLPIALDTKLSSTSSGKVEKTNVGFTVHCN